MTVTDSAGNTGTDTATVTVYPLPDTSAPASVIGLTNITYAQTYINWTWADPADIDFNHVEVYLDGIQKPNVLAGVRNFNATGLTPSTTHEIGTRTVDVAGNINETWVNRSATTAPGRVHNINKGTDYLTIQSAIAAADPGNEIHVDSGTYYENVNVNKRLIMRGIGMPVVDAGGSGSAITLATDGIVLEGFTTTGGSVGISVTSNNNTLFGNNATSSSNYGIGLDSSDNNTLSGNNVSKNNFGITLISSSKNRLIGNNASNNTAGIFLQSSRDNTLSGNIAFNNWYGINLQISSNNNMLNGNDASNKDNAEGIRLHSSNNNMLIGNNASNTYFGIHVYNSINNTLSGNNASNNNYGIYLDRSSNNNTLSGNNASNNSDAGIHLYDSHYNTLCGNNASNNNYGIFLYHSSNNNTVCGNNASNNNYGIYLYTTINNTIYNNIFINLNNIQFSGSNINIWNTTRQSGTNIIGGSYLGGNFWANPSGTGFSQTCTDADRDGICNSVYIIDVNNTDFLPLSTITPLSNSGGGTWQYSRDVTITNPGAALTDYQVLVNLTGAGFPMEANASGADIRFEQGSAELNYWIERWDYANSSALVWVNVTNIPSGTSGMKMWYGNPSATSSSNGTKTFEFFEDWDYSGILDPGFISKYNYWTTHEYWPSTGVVSFSNSKLELTTVSSDWSTVLVASKASYPINQAIDMRLNYGCFGIYCSVAYIAKAGWGLENDGTFWNAGNGGSSLGNYWGNKVLRNINNTDVYNVNSSESQFPNSYETYSVARLSTKGKLFKNYVFDVENGNRYVDTNVNVSFGKEGNWQVPFTIYVDWYKIRKYIEPEPSVSVNAPISYMVSITSPTQQDFAFGTTIDFASQVTGGTSPYTYSWESSRDGIIRTEPSFSKSDLSMGTHTVTFTVTDANSIKATATKVITINGIDLSLKSSDIGFSKAWPMKDEEITINATITNDGSESATNVNVRFYDNELLIGETLIPSISHHSSSLAQINYVSDISGYRLIKVVIDEANSIIEADETNNIAIRPIAVGNGNFYGSIDLSASIQTPKYTGEYTTVSGSAIYNTTFGNGENVAGALVTITVDGISYTTYTTSSGTFSTDIIAPYTSGQYLVSVTISDNTFTQEESLMLTVTHWPAQYPDLVITTNNITFPQSAYVANQSGTVNARILNIGREDASGVTVNFYDDGVLFATNTIPTIPRYGGAVTTSATIAPTYGGTHSITVKVDEGNTIQETNELNNLASRNLYVYPDMPDFTPSYIYYSDSTPYDGQQVTVYAGIRNIGGIDSATSVSFYLDGILKNTVAISVAGRNGYSVASLPMTFTNVGTHQVRVVVDEAGTVQESDEGNNQSTSSLYVHAPQPELKAHDIFLNISGPLSGDSVLVTGTFRNDGETIADNVVANLYISGLLVNTTTIPTLAAGSSQTITSVWTPTSNGYYNILLSVDPSNSITESNENNNNLTRTFYVYPARADPYPFSLVRTPSIAEIGDPVTINAVIKNNGGISTGAMTVKLYDNDTEIFSTSITVPGKGGTVPISTSYVFASSGTHTIKVTVDPDDAIDDFDELNNNLSTTIYILPQLPDIQIRSEDIYYSNNNPDIDENIIIYANVSNVGTYQADNIVVNFTVDDIFIDTTTIPSISSKSFVIITSNWIAEGDGSHVVRVEAIYGGSEFSGTNNAATRGIVVGQSAIPPGSVTDLHNISYASNYINWTWTDPVDIDFNHVEIYLDGIQKPNVLSGFRYYNATGLTASTSHEISTRTVDNLGNVNATWKNHIATTAPIPDTSAPASVTDLHNISYASNYINWTWIDPEDLDFDKVMVYLDGVYKDDVLKGVQYYNASVEPGTYTIGTRTVDMDGNINATMETHTATTILPQIRFINGTVMDSESKEVISDVTVSTGSLSTTTNATGFYSLGVTDGTFVLTATFDITYYTNTTTVSTIGEAFVWHDIELVKKPLGTITGSVTKST
ncbi:MAG: DUF2341 domain-containing protein [Candidatus Methanoperedens sp.]|nr:DUF2341 domain-containing protein [Candidatus Methanoperedens sp.]